MAATSKSKLSSRLPVVCVLAFEGAKDYKELVGEFAAAINKLEPAVYAHNAATRTNLNEKTHRLQFGTVSLSRNPRLRAQLVNKLNKPKPKYLVYVSEAGLVGAFNNIQDLEFVIDDVTHGEYSELTSVKELLGDQDIAQLLRNENLTVVGVVLSQLLASVFMRLAVFGLAFLACVKLLKVDGAKAGLMAGGLVAAMVVHGIVLKLWVEDMM